MTRSLLKESDDEGVGGDCSVGDDGDGVDGRGDGNNGARVVLTT